MTTSSPAGIAADARHLVSLASTKSLTGDKTNTPLIAGSGYSDVDEHASGTQSALSAHQDEATVNARDLNVSGNDRCDLERGHLMKTRTPPRKSAYGAPYIPLHRFLFVLGDLHMKTPESLRDKVHAETQ